MLTSKALRIILSELAYLSIIIIIIIIIIIYSLIESFPHYLGFIQPKT